MRIRHLSTVNLLAALAALAVGPAPLVAQTDNAPWISLFNGKDLAGWSLKGGSGQAYVADGELICHVKAKSTEHTFVCTNETYSDFILEVDVKTDGNFNGGILLRSVDTPPQAAVRLWADMIKIDSTPRKWTGGIFEDFGGVWQWLYTLKNDARARAAYRNNEWNHFRVEAIAQHLKVWINGIPTANLIDDRHTKGYIAFKIHQTDNFPEREKSLAHYKNIRVITATPERFSTPIEIPPGQAEDSGITVPVGFRALLVADDLIVGKKRTEGDKLRFLAVAPNGDIYAKTIKGGLLALRDIDNDSRADQIEEFGSGGGTGIAVHDGWLYHATNSAVYRYRLTHGELVPKGAPELVIGGLPAEGVHEAKTFDFDDQGRLLIEVGSPSNGFGNPDRKEGAKGSDPTEFLKTHGGFWRFDANKTNQAFADGFHYSTGMRHAVNVAWNPVSKTFFVVMMGRDQLNTVAPQYYDALDNAERVAEELHRLDEGANLGWPFTYYDPFKKARMLSPEFGGDNLKRAEAGKYADPLVAFPAHWAPLQMTFYRGKQFPEKYRGGAFVTFHGSWNRAPLPQAGYNVCFVPFNEKGMPAGNYEVFADGFAGLDHGFTAVSEARFQPCGLAVGPDGTLYIGDSEKGRIWRIIHTGEGPAPRPTPRAVLENLFAVAPAQIATDGSTGARIYQSTCALCHMPDGSGVPSMQPPLKGSPVVAGDTTRLIRVILNGPAAVLPANREHFQNVMPPFWSLSDDDVAEVVNYLRRAFAPGSPSVTPAMVAGIRAAKP